MNVVVIGTGYVGITTGLCLAYIGHNVTCLDIDEKKIERLRSGLAPIHEPGLENLMDVAAARVRYETNGKSCVPEADVIFIAVGTPPLPDGNPDLRYLRTASEDIGRWLGNRFTVIVNKSTVPVGSGHWVDSIIRDTYTSEHDTLTDQQFAVASNPEFLREGSAIHDSLYPDRIVVGLTIPVCSTF